MFTSIKFTKKGADAPDAQLNAALKANIQNTSAPNGIM
jgi:hypothetical protein